MAETPVGTGIPSGPGTLDRSLKEQALAAGAEIRFGERVRHPPAESVVAWGPRRADALAVGYLFETDLPDGSFAVLDDRLAPGSPLGGDATDRDRSPERRGVGLAAGLDFRGFMTYCVACCGAEVVPSVKPDTYERDLVFGQALFVCGQEREKRACATRAK